MLLRATFVRSATVPSTNLPSLTPQAPERKTSSSVPMALERKGVGGGAFLLEMAFLGPPVRWRAVAVISTSVPAGRALTPTHVREGLTSPVKTDR
jgi:hypothetical protein